MSIHFTTALAVHPVRAFFDQQSAVLCLEVAEILSSQASMQTTDGVDNALQDMTTVCKDELRKLKKEDPRYSGKLNSHALCDAKRLAVTYMYCALQPVEGYYSF